VFIYYTVFLKQKPKDILHYAVKRYTSVAVRSTEDKRLKDKRTKILNNAQTFEFHTQQLLVL